MNKTRIIADILLLGVVILGWAPLVLLLGSFFVFRFRRYSEFLFAGFLFELLYGTGLWSFPLPFPMFLASAFLFVLMEFIRTKVRS